QPVPDQPVERAFRILPIGVALTRRDAGQELHALVDAAHSPDVKPTGTDSINDLFVKHQVWHVRSRDDDPLLTCQTLGLADGEEAFNLGCNPTHSLNLTVLIDGAGNGNALAKWQARESREERVQLGRRG